MYMEMDLVLYEKCSRENTERMQQEEMDRKNADTRWDTIMKQVQSILSYLVVIVLFGFSWIALRVALLSLTARLIQN
jgi:hypothetical protein